MVGYCVMKKILLSFGIVVIGAFLVLKQFGQLQVEAAACTGMKNAIYTISGRITNQNLQPLSSVTVKAIHTKNSQCVTGKTDADGRYVLSVAKGPMKIQPLKFSNLRWVPKLYNVRITASKDNLNFVGQP